MPPKARNPLERERRHETELGTHGIFPSSAGNVGGNASVAQEAPRRLTLKDAIDLALKQNVECPSFRDPDW